MKCNCNHKNELVNGYPLPNVMILGFPLIEHRKGHWNVCGCICHFEADGYSEEQLGIAKELEWHRYD